MSRTSKYRTQGKLMKNSNAMSHVYCSRAFTGLMDKSSPRQGDNYHGRIISIDYVMRTHVTVTEKGSNLELTNAKEECEVAVDGNKKPDIVHTVKIQGNMIKIINIHFI